MNGRIIEVGDEEDLRMVTPLAVLAKFGLVLFLRRNFVMLLSLHAEPSPVDTAVIDNFAADDFVTLRSGGAADLDRGH